jgi:hypothetical protein
MRVHQGQRLEYYLLVFFQPAISRTLGKLTIGLVTMKAILHM